MRILTYIGIPWVDFIFWEIFMWISTRGISQFWFKPIKIWTSKWVSYKSLHFFLLLPPWVSPKCRVDIDGLILESLHSSICLVEIKHVSLRLQVAETCWTAEVSFGFDTTMLNVSRLVRSLASVGVLRGYLQC
jgi:hypothetical protein